jgi:hypothetical protein
MLGSYHTYCEPWERTSGCEFQLETLHAYLLSYSIISHIAYLEKALSLIGKKIFSWLLSLNYNCLLAGFL